MKELAIFITDTHFGARNSSRTWWKKQSAFIYDQLIPHIKELKNSGHQITLLHLGDVFDSKHSINTYIAAETRILFTEIAKYTSRLYIIPGNHDYFSEQTDSYCTSKLLLNNIPGIYIIEKAEVIEIFSNKYAMALPWHAQKEIEDLVGFSNHCVYNQGIDLILTHTDLTRYKSLDHKFRCPIFSGHIHTPLIMKNIYNLGSCYPMTFADSNSERYFYIYDSEGNLSKIPNKESIKFWRFRNEEIFNIQKLYKANLDDYIECYIDLSKMNSKEYLDEIKNIRTTYRNSWIIPLSENDSIDGTEIDFNFCMDDIIEKSIPNHLMSKFEYIKKLINF